MPFVCAKTGSIIVPIAAKRAKSTWWTTRVIAEFRKAELKLTSDSRLRAGVRAALEHFTERHGLTKPEQHEFAASVEAKIPQAMENREDSGCLVKICESDEKIEVSVEPTEKTNASYERTGHAHATLVKHFHKTAHS